MMAILSRKLLLPLCDPDHYWGFTARLAALEHFETLDPQEQAAISQRRTRSLLDHAYKTSPYYRLVFDGMRFRSVDWHYGQPIPLPELNRELLTANMESLCSRAFRPDELRRFSSGGSPPAARWRDVDAQREKAALEYHLNRLSGAAGARILELRQAGRQQDDVSNAARPTLQERILGRSITAIRNPDDESFWNLLNYLNRRKPEVLHGPASLLAMFAEWLCTCGMAWHRPRRVIVTGETPSPESRQAVAETFGCAVIGQYVFPDVGILATECEQGERLHFHPLSSYISLVPAGRSSGGSIYRLIITDLLNRGMPLIRYDSGDCVLFDESPCRCGCWYPSVSAILGPAIENLILPDGTVTAGVPIVRRASRGFRAVHGVQLIQRAPDTMHLRFSADEDCSAADRELGVFRKTVEDAFRTPLRWTVERVAEIPSESAGKARVAVCDIPQDEHGRPLGP